LSSGKNKHKKDLILIMIKHEAYIKRTYQLAKSAQEKGNHPFGALLVIDNRVVFTAENSVITDNDITKHAELNLVSKVTQEIDSEALSQSILYTSTEPCAMCTGAIFWAGIPNIVYGCSTEVLGEIVGCAFVVPCRDLLNYGKRKVNVVGPVLEDQGAVIHRNFW
jgi:tRNA(Arg) A34 adenosine deaminase TadA